MDGEIGVFKNGSRGFERLRLMKQIVKVPIPENFIAALQFALHGIPPFVWRGDPGEMGAQATSKKRDD
jgi:hypothetical protein